jgi:hypothetical protein
MVEVAETSAVGRALAFAGFGGQDVATADDMARKATSPKMPPKRHRETVEGLLKRSNPDAPDDMGTLEIWEEMTQDEQEFIWRSMRSYERAQIKAAITRGRGEVEETPDPRYVDPAPLHNPRKAKEDKRKANA